MKQKGFTLTELLAVAAVILIITSFSVPSFAALQRHLESESTRQNWIQFLNYGRSAAVSYQSTVTACPMPESECTDDLNDRWKLFTDSNKNKILDSDEIIIREFKPNEDHRLKVYPANRYFLRFYDEPTGAYSGLMSSLTICTNGIADEYASHLTINIMGRVTALKEVDNNGVVQRTVNGKAETVTC